MADWSRGDPERRYNDAGRVSRELHRLDPWSFWFVPAQAEEFGDFAVVGTTGAFLVMIVDSEVYPAVTGRTMKVNGRRVPGLRALRRSARKIRGRLAATAVFVEVEPVACFTRAPAGPSRTVSGVRAVAVSMLVRDLTDRPNILTPNRARKGAMALGLAIQPKPEPDEDE